MLQGDPDEKKPNEDKGHQLRSVLYEGVLKVTGPDLFRQTLIHGIGSGKAYGFGLLSVAPAKSEADYG